MSPRIRWIGYCGNGAVTIFSGLLALYSTGRYGFLPVGIEVAVCALAIFNIKIIAWTVQVTSEEEWLKAEVRKAELRQHLASLGQFAPAQDALSVAINVPTASSASPAHHPPILDQIAETENDETH